MPAEYYDLTSEDENHTLADAQNRSMGIPNRRTVETVKYHADEETEDPEGDYRLQKALKPPRATTYTAQALYEQIQSRDIDLEPEYQRDVVWTETKQIGLIDSILRNFYIPPIIFAVNSFDDGFETKTCIDGKQRLTSMYKFMDGHIPHRDPITNEKFWYKKNPVAQQNKKIRLLPEKYRRAFSNKQIVCVEYQDLTDANERDIFQRVQLGMALTPAEKLHVINTPRANFIRSLITSYVEQNTLGDPRLMPWDRTRGSDFRCVAQAVFVMSKWGTNTILGSGSLPQVERWLMEKGEEISKSGRTGGKKKGPGRPSKKKGRDYDMDVDDEEDEIDDDNDGDYTDAPQVSEAFALKVKETYGILSELASTEGLSTVFHLTNAPKVSPIEMICIPILIYAHGVIPKTNARLSLRQLADAIGDMRAKVRLAHKDIRMNDRVGKFMIEHIHNMGTPNVTLSAVPTPTLDVNPLAINMTTPASFSSGSKRKRDSVATLQEDEEPAPPVSNTKPTLRRKIASLEQTSSGSGRNLLQPIPTPPPWATLPRAESPVPSRNRDDFAAMREARNLTSSQQRQSPPNPQRLPSPDHGNSAFSPFATFQKSSQPQRPNSTGSDSEVKREPDSRSSLPPTSNVQDPAMMQQLLGFQMMGIAPGQPRP